MLPRALRFPLLFFVLVMPYGAAFGFVGVAFPYIATHRGVDVAKVTAIMALAFLPHGWKFLWAPVVDGLWTRRTWCFLGILASAAGTVVSTALPVSKAGLALLTLVIVVSQLGVSIIGISCDALIAVSVPEEQKGRVAGWYQAGSFVGVGAGGALVLVLAQRLPQGWEAGAIVGAIEIVCAFPLLFLVEPAHEAGRRPAQVVRTLLRDLWRTVRTRHGLTGLLICLSPVGAGGLSNLFSAIADRYHAGAGQVALVTGVVGGLVSAGGCLVGGFLADRMNRRLAYALAGVGTACVAVALIFAPTTPDTYTIGTLAYSFFNGIAFATFSAFVLDTIGGGAAAATKYTVFAALANNAIAYMTKIDGAAYGRWQLRGAFLTDALFTLGGVVVLIVLVRLVGRAPARTVEPVAERAFGDELPAGEPPPSS